MSQIIVSKFGGSSMKDHEAMLRSAKIAHEQKTLQEKSLCNLLINI
mgnify:CR=1 FL=1